MENELAKQSEALKRSEGKASSSSNMAHSLQLQLSALETTLDVAKQGEEKASAEAIELRVKLADREGE